MADTNYKYVPTWREINNELEELKERFIKSEFTRISLQTKVMAQSTEIEVLHGKLQLLNCE